MVSTHTFDPPAPTSGLYPPLGLTKIKNKLYMKAVNYTCFKLEEKITRSVKTNKSNFINFIGDKFAMSIR